MLEKRLCGGRGTGIRARGAETIAADVEGRKSAACVVSGRMVGKKLQLKT